MNAISSPLDLMWGAVLVIAGGGFMLAVRRLIRGRREMARKRADPRMLTFSHVLGGFRPNTRIVVHSRSRVEAREFT